MASEYGGKYVDWKKMKVMAQPFDGEAPISANRVMELLYEFQDILTELSYGVRLYETDDNDFPLTDEGVASHYYVRSLFRLIGSETVFQIVEDNLLSDLTTDLHKVDASDNLVLSNHLSPVEHYQKYREEYDHQVRRLLKY